jgi:hypothetical protein
MLGMTGRGGIHYGVGVAIVIAFICLALFIASELIS